MRETEKAGDLHMQAHVHVQVWEFVERRNEGLLSRDGVPEGSGGFRECSSTFLVLVQKIMQYYRTSAFEPSKTRRTIVTVFGFMFKHVVAFILVLTNMLKLVVQITLCL